MVKNILDYILRLPGFYQLYNIKENSKKMELIYKISDLNKKYYNKIKKLGDDELEHQIGRLTNFKEIIEKCANLEGDFIEFGSWKGFSLLWIAYFMERNAIFKKKLLGLDGFIGLPYNDGVFSKGSFNNTSLKVCRKNVIKNNNLYSITKRKIIIEKFLYSQKRTIIKFIKNNKINKFCFIHIDCDVYQSAKEIFKILIDGNLIADKSYILFDDYGCNSDLKKTVNEFIDKMKSNWIIEEHSQTKLTKNFVFTKIK